MNKNKKTVLISNNDTFKWDHDGQKYCLHIMSDDDREDSPRDWSPVTTMACWHRRYTLGDKIENKGDPTDFWRNLVDETYSAEQLADAVMNGKVPGMRIAVHENEPEMADLYVTCDLGFGEGPKEYLQRDGVEFRYIGDYITEELSISQCMALMEPHAEWLPLWLYDHGGITMSCGTRSYPYNDAWDSGQVGWIVALKATLFKEGINELLLDENGEPIRIAHEHQQPDGTVTYTYSCEYKPLGEDNWRKVAIATMESDVKIYDQYLTGEVYGYQLYKADGVDDDGEIDWVEEDSCWSFYGDDLMTNGMLDNVGCGLKEALESGAYEEGEAKLHTCSHYTF